MSLPDRVQGSAAGAALTLLATAALTGVMAPLQHRIGLLNEALALLLLALLASAIWGWRVGLFAAVLTNLSLNFFFVQPLHTFSVRDSADVFGLSLFIAVAMVGGLLLSAAQRAAAEARRRQAETQVLLSLSRAMIGRTDPQDALAALCQEVLAALRPEGAAVLSLAGGTWRVLASAGAESASRDAGHRGARDGGAGARVEFAGDARAHGHLLLRAHGASWCARASSGASKR